jgi:hypothetical protein
MMTLGRTESDGVGTTVHTFDYDGLTRHLFIREIGEAFVVTAVLAPDGTAIGFAINEVHRGATSQPRGVLGEFGTLEAPGDPSLWHILDPAALTRGSEDAAEASAQWSSAREFWRTGQAVRMLGPRGTHPKFPLSPTSAPLVANLFCWQRNYALLSTVACFWAKLCEWAQCIDDHAKRGDSNIGECQDYLDQAKACIGNVAY